MSKLFQRAMFYGGLTLAGAGGVAGGYYTWPLVFTSPTAAAVSADETSGGGPNRQPTNGDPGAQGSDGADAIVNSNQEVPKVDSDGGEGAPLRDAPGGEIVDAGENAPPRRRPPAIASRRAWETRQAGHEDDGARPEVIRANDGEGLPQQPPPFAWQTPAEPTEPTPASPRGYEASASPGGFVAPSASASQASESYPPPPAFQQPSTFARPDALAPRGEFAAPAELAPTDEPALSTAVERSPAEAEAPAQAATEARPAPLVGQSRLARPIGGRQAAPVENTPALEVAPEVPGSPLVGDVIGVPGAAESGNSLEGDAPGLGEPGPKQWEGVQAPTLTIEKFAPPEIQVGKTATFEIRVQNVGQTEARQVVVTDQAPRGARFVTAKPAPTRLAGGELTWELGSLKAGERATIEMQLLPLAEGEIGSVARVGFQTAASARSVCTRPLLAVSHSGPTSVLIGESVKLSIVISNPGTGVATGVVLEEDVPEGLTHPAGGELEYEIGTLRPGETRKLDLTLTANKAGVAHNEIVVRGDGNLLARHKLQLQVTAPRLELALQGPKKRFLERQATYTVQVANPGTASAEDIDLALYLPKGMKFVEANNSGQYDAASHAVYWSLEELPPRELGAVQVTAMPIDVGEQKLRVHGKAKLGLENQQEQLVSVEALAELAFRVSKAADPIEVGAENLYTVEVANSGTKQAENVRLEVLFPTEILPLAGEGPTRGAVGDQRVSFEPLARLAPQEKAVFKVRGRGLAAGDHRVRVQVTSDENRAPIVKEDSTRVYADQ